MHGLEDQTAVLALDVDDALGAQDVLAMLTQQLVQPVREFLAVHRAVERQGDALDVILVGVAAGAVIVIVVVMGVVVPVIVVVVMMVVAAVVVVDVAGGAVRRIDEVGADLGDALEVEAVDAEDLVQRHVGALSAGDGGQWVEGAQAGLDRVQLDLGDEVGLVEDDLVGEGDLLAGLLRVIKAGMCCGASFWKKCPPLIPSG